MDSVYTSNTSQENYPCIATYINKQILYLRFTLYTNLINHCDINVLVFYNDWDINFIINIYSDSNQIVLQTLHCNIRDIGITVAIRAMTSDWLKVVTNFIWTITLGILDRFWQSKWPPKALKKTFQTVPKTSQSDQY